MSNFTLIKQFHAKFDPVGTGENYDSLLPRRLAYLLDETQEAAEAADDLFAAVDPEKPSAPETIRECKAHLIKELVDVLQVTYGFLHILDVDAEAAFAEVMRSNMSKTPNPGGKALKGEGYVTAEMEQFV